MAVRRGIILGHNLPLLLWSAAAVARVFGPAGPGFPCPVKALLGWCPGCGLTDAYARFLSGRGIDNPWFAVVFAGFLGNLAWSLVKAGRVSPGGTKAGRTGAEGAIPRREP
jgi:hypothetical protein